MPIEPLWGRQQFDGRSFPAASNRELALKVNEIIKAYNALEQRYLALERHYKEHMRVEHNVRPRPGF
jgi:hypothetical protein